MWSLYVGRPWGLGFQDITIPLPSEEQDKYRAKTWSPYPATGEVVGLPDQGVFFPLEACTAANITLCDFMRRINTTL